MNFMAKLRKAQQIAIFEYQRQVFTWRFWLSLLAAPLVLAGIFGIFFLANWLAVDHAPVGVVGAGSINLAPAAGEEPEHRFVAFADEPAARSALLDQVIQAYYVLPDEYPDDRDVRLVYLKPPSKNLAYAFYRLLRRQALAGLPAERARRLEYGTYVLLQSGQIEAPSRVTTLLRLLFAASGIYMLLLVNSFTANYMVSTLTEERNNRTLEVLITSADCNQILIGMIAGQVGVVLTLVIFMFGIPFLGLLLMRQVLLPILGEIFTWQQLVVILAAGFLNLVFMSVLLSTLGITVLDPSEAQLAAMFFNFCLGIPLLMFQALSDAPGGPVSLFLTFFPLTGAGTMIVRMSIGSMPAWQMWVSLLLLLASTRAAFWLAGRLFWRGLQERPKFKLHLDPLKSFFRRAWKPRNA